MKRSLGLAAWSLSVWLATVSSENVEFRVPVGSDAPLHCAPGRHVSGDATEFVWEMKERSVGHFRRGQAQLGQGFENRVTFRPDSVETSDFSITIQRIEESDEGVYSCYWRQGDGELQFACSVFVQVIAPEGEVDISARDPVFPARGPEAESSTPSNPTTPPAETGVRNRENRLIILPAAATAVATLVLGLLFVVRKKKMITKLKELKQQRGLTAVTVVSDEISVPLKRICSPTDTALRLGLQSSPVDTSLPPKTPSCCDCVLRLCPLSSSRLSAVQLL